jgi:hypothetical protein
VNSIGAPTFQGSRLALPLPWKKGQHQTQPQYHCLASELPLNRYRDIPRFLLWTLRIRKQLKEATGLVGYSLKADLLHKTFATLSAWETPKHMMSFVQSGVHKQMLADMKGRLGSSKFVEWQANAKELPLTWKIANGKLHP